MDILDIKGGFINETDQQDKNIRKYKGALLYHYLWQSFEYLPEKTRRLQDVKNKSE